MISFELANRIARALGMRPGLCDDDLLRGLDDRIRSGGATEELMALVNAVAGVDEVLERAVHDALIRGRERGKLPPRLEGLLD